MATINDIRKYTFTDGAHITPILYDGKWVWMVTEFEGDTYCDGENISPNQSADTMDELVHPDDLTE